MLEQLGLIGTIQDEDQGPEEPDTESDQEVSKTGYKSETLPGGSARPGGWRRTGARLVFPGDFL